MAQNAHVAIQHPVESTFAVRLWSSVAGPNSVLSSLSDSSASLRFFVEWCASSPFAPAAALLAVYSALPMILEARKRLLDLLLCFFATVAASAFRWLVEAIFVAHASIPWGTLYLASPLIVGAVSLVAVWWLAEKAVHTPMLLVRILVGAVFSFVGERLYYAPAVLLLFVLLLRPFPGVSAALWHQLIRFIRVILYAAFGYGFRQCDREVPPSPSGGSPIRQRVLEDQGPPSPSGGSPIRQRVLEDQGLPSPSGGSPIRQCVIEDMGFPSPFKHAPVHRGVRYSTSW